LKDIAWKEISAVPEIKKVLTEGELQILPDGISEDPVSLK
jgi:hypothetical protein